MEYNDSESVESMECVKPFTTIPDCIEEIAFFAHRLNEVAQGMSKHDQVELLDRLMRTCQEFCENPPPPPNFKDKVLEYSVFADLAPCIQEPTRKRPIESESVSPEDSSENKRRRTSEQEKRQTLRDLWIEREKKEKEAKESKEKAGYSPFLDGPNIKEIKRIDSDGIHCVIAFPVNIANAPIRETCIPFSFNLSQQSRCSFSNQMDEAYERCRSEKWKTKCYKTLKRLLKKELDTFGENIDISSPEQMELACEFKEFLARNKLGELRL